MTRLKSNDDDDFNEDSDDDYQYNEDCRKMEIQSKR